MLTVIHMYLESRQKSYYESWKNLRKVISLREIQKSLSTIIIVQFSPEENWVIEEALLICPIVQRFKSDTVKTFYPL